MFLVSGWTKRVFTWSCLEPLRQEKKKSRWWSRKEKRVAAKIVELIVMSELQDKKERPEIRSPKT